MQKLTSVVISILSQNCNHLQNSRNKFHLRFLYTANWCLGLLCNFCLNTNKKSSPRKPLRISIKKIGVFKQENYFPVRGAVNIFVFLTFFNIEWNCNIQKQSFYSRTLEVFCIDFGDTFPVKNAEINISTRFFINSMTSQAYPILDDTKIMSSICYPIHSTIKRNKS